MWSAIFKFIIFEINILLFSLIIESEVNKYFIDLDINRLSSFLLFIIINSILLDVFFQIDNHYENSWLRSKSARVLWFIMFLFSIIPYTYIHEGYTIEEYISVEKHKIYNVRTFVKEENYTNNINNMTTFRQETNKKYSFYKEDEETGLLKEKEFYARDVLVNVSDSEEPSYSYKVLHKKVKYQIDDNIIFEKDLPTSYPKDDKVIITVSSTDSL